MKELVFRCRVIRGTGSSSAAKGRGLKTGKGIGVSGVNTQIIPNEDTSSAGLSRGLSELEDRQLEISKELYR